MLPTSTVKIAKARDLSKGKNSARSHANVALRVNGCFDAQQQGRGGGQKLKLAAISTAFKQNTHFISV
jgi:hypothetical protein